MEKYFDILMENPLFGGISREELASMLGCLNARATQVKKGAPVFLEGDPAGFIGVVLSGAVRIVRDDYYGQRSFIAQAEPGDIFAEAYACAPVDTMPISGYAAEDSQVLLLSARKMLTICTIACGFHNRLVKNLLAVMAEKNLRLSRKIQFMAQKTTREKLMAYLLDQAKQHGSNEFTIPLDRQALADYLGVERSAMSAEIGRLARDGVIACERRHFRLL